MSSGKGTGGGLIQLVAYGAEDVYLTGSPQISFFKSVFKRYTHFALETITLNTNKEIPNLNSLSPAITFNIERNADLLKNQFLRFILPSVKNYNQDFNPKDNELQFYIPDLSLQPSIRWDLSRAVIETDLITIDSEQGVKISGYLTTRNIDLSGLLGGLINIPFVGALNFPFEKIEDDFITVNKIKKVNPINLSLSDPPYPLNIASLDQETFIQPYVFVKGIIKNFDIDNITEYTDEETFDVYYSYPFTWDVDTNAGGALATHFYFYDYTQINPLTVRSPHYWLSLADYINNTNQINEYITGGIANYYSRPVSDDDLIPLNGTLYGGIVGSVGQTNTNYTINMTQTLVYDLLSDPNSTKMFKLTGEKTITNTINYTTPTQITWNTDVETDVLFNTYKYSTVFEHTLDYTSNVNGLIEGILNYSGLSSEFFQTASYYDTLFISLEDPFNEVLVGEVLENKANDGTIDITLTGNLPLGTFNLLYTFSLDGILFVGINLVKTITNVNGVYNVSFSGEIRNQVSLETVGVMRGSLKTLDNTNEDPELEISVWLKNGERVFPTALDYLFLTDGTIDSYEFDFNKVFPNDIFGGLLEGYFIIERNIATNTFLPDVIVDITYETDYETYVNNVLLIDYTRVGDIFTINVNLELVNSLNNKILLARGIITAQYNSFANTFLTNTADIKLYLLLFTSPPVQFNGSMNSNGELILPEKKVVYTHTVEIDPYTNEAKYKPLNLNSRKNFMWKLDFMKNAYFWINGQEIERFPGIFILSDTRASTSGEKQKMLNRLVGLTPELINPEFYPTPRVELFVPLNFWYTRNSGWAIPLIALQESLISIGIDLWTLGTINKPSQGYGNNHWYSGIPQDEIEINNFYLEAEYVYLDKEERLKYTTAGQQYLVEQIQENIFNIKFPNSIFQLKMNHPISELTFYAKTVGDTYNYPLNQYFGIQPDINYIKNIRILFNGNERLQKKSIRYYDTIVPYLYHRGDTYPYYSYYSFSLDPHGIQPKGSCNFTRLNNVSLEIEFDERFVNKRILFDEKTGNPQTELNVNNGTSTVKLTTGETLFYVYGKNYNILNIMNGLGGLKFAT